MAFSLGFGAEALGADFAGAAAGDVLAGGAFDAGAGALAAGGGDALFSAVPLAETGGELAGGVGGFDAAALGGSALADTAAPLAGGAAEGALPVATEAFSGADIAGFGGALPFGGGSGDIGGLQGQLGLNDIPASQGFMSPATKIQPLLGGAGPASTSESAVGPTELLNQEATDPLSNVSGGDPLQTDVLPTPNTSQEGALANTSQQSILAPQNEPPPAGPPPSPSPMPGSTAPAGGPSPASTAGGAPAAAPPAKAAAGGGGFDWMKAATLGLGAAPLALTLAKGESPLPPQAAQLSSTNTGLQNFANTALANVTNNTTNPAQSAQLATDRQTLINKWRQTLFNQGVQNPEADSRWPQIMAQIDQQIAQETQSFIQTNLQAALGASGQASTNLTNLAQMQIAQDTAYTNAISNASRALGGVAALAGR